MLNKLNQILSLFSDERPELAVTEVMERLRRPKSTAYRLLTKIEKEGFLDRDEATGRYRLGIRLAAIGDLATRSTSLQRLVLPAMRRLSEETQETATLLLLQHGEGVAVNHVESSLPVMMKGTLGRHWPLHASAGGKVFLIWLPEARRRELLSRPLKRYTDATITDVRALERELKQGRQRGYTSVRGEFIEDVWGVAAPIWDHRDELVAAMTLGGPRSRVKSQIPVLGRSVIEACEGVSRALGYRGEYAGNGVRKKPARRTKESDPAPVRDANRARSSRRRHGNSKLPRGPARPPNP